MGEESVRREHPEPELRIKLEKGQRNTYAWEISASAPGHDADELLGVIEEVDSKLRRRYGPIEEEPRGPRAA